MYYNLLDVIQIITVYYQEKLEDKTNRYKKLFLSLFELYISFN